MCYPVLGAIYTYLWVIDYQMSGYHFGMSLLDSLLATTSADGSCKIWSTADFTERNTLRKGTNKKWVWDCAFSSDSQYVITGE